jgi:flavorubredoxin
VVKQETRVLVLFEDGKLEIEKQARAIAERLGELGRSVTIKASSSIEISEVLAADLFLLGIGDSGSPSYAELGRLFKGMNLAGRKAAFFGSSGASVAWLRGLCADTELSAAHVDFIGRPEPAPLAAWLKGVLASA